MANRGEEKVLPSRRTASTADERFVKDKSPANGAVAKIAPKQVRQYKVRKHAAGPKIPTRPSIAEANMEWEATTDAEMIPMAMRPGSIRAGRRDIPEPEVVAAPAAIIPTRAVTPKSNVGSPNRRPSSSSGFYSPLHGSAASPVRPRSSGGLGGFYSAEPGARMRPRSATPSAADRPGSAVSTVSRPSSALAMRSLAPNVRSPNDSKVRRSLDAQFDEETDSTGFQTHPESTYDFDDCLLSWLSTIAGCGPIGSLGSLADGVTFAQVLSVIAPQVSNELLDICVGESPLVRRSNLTRIVSTCQRNLRSSSLKRPLPDVTVDNQNSAEVIRHILSSIAAVAAVRAPGVLPDRENRCGKALRQAIRHYAGREFSDWAETPFPEGPPQWERDARGIALELTIVDGRLPVGDYLGYTCVITVVQRVPGQRTPNTEQFETAINAQPLWRHRLWLFAFDPDGSVGIDVFALTDQSRVSCGHIHVPLNHVDLQMATDASVVFPLVSAARNHVAGGSLALKFYSPAVPHNPVHRLNAPRADDNCTIITLCGMIPVGNLRRSLTHVVNTTSLDERLLTMGARLSLTHPLLFRVVFSVAEIVAANLIGAVLGCSVTDYSTLDSVGSGIADESTSVFGLGRCNGELTVVQFDMAPAATPGHLVLSIASTVAAVAHGLAWQTKGAPLRIVRIAFAVMNAGDAPGASRELWQLRDDGGQANLLEIHRIVLDSGEKSYQTPSLDRWLKVLRRNTQLNSSAKWNDLFGQEPTFSLLAHALALLVNDRTVLAISARGPTPPADSVILENSITLSWKLQHAQRTAEELEVELARVREKLSEAKRAKGKLV